MLLKEKSVKEMFIYSIKAVKAGKKTTKQKKKIFHFACQLLFPFVLITYKKNMLTSSCLINKRK